MARNVPAEGILVVESTPSERALAVIAIALRRPGARVTEAADLAGALQAQARQDGGLRLVILGWQALRDAAEGTVTQLQGDAKIPVIGLVGEMTQGDRQRALEAGVREIYERPRDFRPYCEAVERMLARWIDGQPGGAP